MKRCEAATTVGCLLVLLTLLPVQLTAQNVNMGDNFDGLELLATRIETVFGNGCVAVTRPMSGGLFVAESRMVTSASTSRIRVAQSIVSGELAIEADGREIARLRAPTGWSVSLDWLNAQACSLLSDIGDGSGDDVAQELVWNDGLFRDSSRADANRRNLKEMSADVRVVRADFADASVTTSTTPGDPQHRGVSWESTVRAPGTNKVLGRVRLWTATQAVQFSFPGLTDDASISPKNLGRPFPFDPTPAWGTIQALSFYKSLNRQSEHAAPVQAASLRSASIKSVPVRRQDGCTGLWWLNGSLFELCCNRHDKCFAQYQCDASSWFAWGYQWWACTGCNLAVVICFQQVACGYMGGIACP